MFLDILVLGLILSAVYALVAMGLNLQYGVARIMNLASGEMFIVGGLTAFGLFQFQALSPYYTAILVIPLAFAGNYAIYMLLLRPLVRRAKSQGQLEVDSILATFGISFIVLGLVSLIYNRQFSYNFLMEPVSVLGTATSLNRIVAFVSAVVIAGAMYIWLYRTRSGVALRAVSVSTEASGLVGINVERLSAFAFALGGTITALGGVILSTFLQLDPSQGMVFTLKALIIVIMGGVGDMRGVVIAAVILGIVETAVSLLFDPGLTLAAAYLIFILVLLFRPQGLFGRRPT